MAKTITLKYKDKDYTLEFNRDAIRTLESEGFSFAKTVEEELYVTLIDNLFRGAFLMHHPYISPDFVKEMYDGIKDKEGLLQRLMEMYTDTINTLSDEGNIEWNASW